MSIIENIRTTKQKPNGKKEKNTDLMRIDNIINSQKIINETNLNLMEFKTADEICDFAVEKIRNYIPNSKVVVHLFNPFKKTLRIKSHAGFDKIANKIFNLFGYDPTEKEFALDTIATTDEEMFFSSTLEEYTGGICGIIGKSAPKFVCDSIEKLLGIHKIFIMDFIWKGKYFGGVIVFTNKEKIDNKNFVENFISQAATSLQRLYIEKELEQTFSFYRQIINSSKEGILVLNNDYSCVLWNPALEDITGLSSTELIGKKIEQLPSFLQIYDVILLINKAFAGDTVTTKDYLFINKKLKKTLWLQYKFIPLKDFQGQINGVLCTIIDQTERKSLNEELSKRLELESAISYISSGFVNFVHLDEAVDIALEMIGRLTGATRSYLYLLSENGEFLNNTNEWFTFGSEPQKHLMQNLSSENFPWWMYCLQNEKVIFIDDVSNLPYEAFEEKKILDKLNVKSILVFPLSPYGKLAGFIGLDNVDTTNKWLQTYINLVQTVSVIISNVLERKQAEEDTIRAMILAEESDKLKSAFLANMSHEIRTPMNGIIGFSNLLIDEDIPIEEKTEFAKIIKTSSNRLLRLINDILDISKLEAGQMELREKPFYLNNVIKDIYEFFKQEIILKNLELETFIDFSFDKSSIISDEQKIHQILSNLISNAIKFTEKGKISFGYKLKNELIEFFVKDSGNGISDEFLPHIFERFRQEDFSLSRKYEGTGLGLSICKGLIEILGGNIWVESEQKLGSTFYFTISYKTDNRKKSNEIIDSNHFEDYSFLSKCTILYAEDDLVNFKYLESFLINHTSAKIINAVNGNDAIEQIKNNSKIDIILMDLKMPLMNGMEAVKLIKKINSKIPIIAVTARAMSGDKESALEAGFDAYVAKPFDFTDLIKTIHRVLNKY